MKICSGRKIILFIPRAGNCLG